MFKVSREPALILALLAALIQVVSVFIFHWTDTQQSLLNAAAIAVAGVITAAWVKAEPLAPAVLGGVQAVVAVSLGFGAHIDPAGQSAIMAISAAVVAMFVRTAVTAPVDAAGNPVEGPPVSSPA